MEELRFSVDEQKYDDRHGQVLSLTGWYVPAEGQTPEFRFLGDGKEIAVPAPKRSPRPDVAQALERNLGQFLPGFTVCIPEADRLAEKYHTVELILTDGAETHSVWKKSREELEAFLQESLLEYHMDRVEILYDTMLEIQGWVMDQRGDAAAELLNEDESPVPCRMSRGRRPDVVERRGLDEEYKNREIGFRISATMDEIAGKKVILRFTGSSVRKDH